MLTKTRSGRFPFNDTGALVGIALLKVAFHFVGNHGLHGYGFFRDEFYYLACAERLDWGYVDHPPLSIVFLRASRWLLGDSLFALRVLPALAGAGTVLLAGLIAREMGGKGFSQSLVALAVTFAPVILALNSFYSTNAFEVLLWVLSAYLLTRLLKRDQPRLWPWIGLSVGLSVQTKHTSVMFALGLVLGLVVTSARRYLRSKWLWLGGGIALLVVLPNLIWQAHYGWPSLEFYGNAHTFKNLATSAPDVLLLQLVAAGPVALPLWLTGLSFFLFTRKGRPYRLLGVIYLTVLLALIVSRSNRPDRIAGAYPMLMASGAVVLEGAVRRHNRRALAAVCMGIVVFGGLVVTPLGLPILPPETTAKMTAVAGLTEKMDGRAGGQLPGYLADRFGWEELVEAVGEVYSWIPAEERSKVTIFTSNYGQAGAIELLGSAHGLPKAISGHNSYCLWGPGDEAGQVFILIGGGPGRYLQLFASVHLVKTFRCRYCMEDHTPIYLARQLRRPIDEVWPLVKHYE